MNYSTTMILFLGKVLVLHLNQRGIYDINNSKMRAQHVSEKNHSIFFIFQVLMSEGIS